MDVATLGLRLDGSQMNAGINQTKQQLASLAAQGAATKASLATVTSTLPTTMKGTTSAVAALQGEFNHLNNRLATGRISGTAYAVELRAMQAQARELATSTKLSGDAMGQLAQTTTAMNTAAREYQRTLTGANSAQASFMSTANQTGGSLMTLRGQIMAAASAFGAYKAASFILGSINLAARYETLGVAMGQVGKIAGFTRTEMGYFQKKMQETGISAIGAREALLMMAAAQLDLSKASDLARVAQDVAIVRNKTSAEMLETFTRGIVGGRAQILRYVGVMVDFEGGYERFAKANGKSAESLTEAEKVQARFNEALRVGANYAGAYTAAMGTAGKQLTSTVRYMEDMRAKAGTAFLPAYTQLVFAYANGLKWLGTHATSVSAAFSSLIRAVTLAVVGFTAFKVLTAAGGFIGTLQIWGQMAVGMNTLAKATWFATLAAQAFKAAIPWGWVLFLGSAALYLTNYFMKQKEAADELGVMARNAAAAQQGLDNFAISIRRLGAEALRDRLREINGEIREIAAQARARLTMSGGRQGVTDDEFRRVRELTARSRVVREALAGRDGTGETPPDDKAAEYRNAERQRRMEVEQLRGLNDVIGQTEYETRLLNLTNERAMQLAENEQEYTGRRLRRMNELTNQLFDQKVRTEALNFANEQQLQKVRALAEADRERHAAQRQLAISDREALERGRLATKEAQLALAQSDREDKMRSEALRKSWMVDSAESLKTMVKDMQRTMSGFFEDLFNGGTDTFKKLFDGVKSMFAKMVADMLAMKLQTKLGAILPMGFGPNGGGSAGFMGHLTGGLMTAGAGFGVGYGVGQAFGGNRTAGGIGGALSGAAAGALAGSVIPGIGTAVGAVIGGLSGLVGGLMGASKAAAAAAEAMKRLNLNLETWRAQVAGTDTPLAQQIRQVRAEASQMRQDAIDAVGMKASRGIRREINSLEAQRIAMLEREAAVLRKRSLEDLEVRRLRAGGQDAAADRLAFRLQLDREYEQAVKENRDALYLNTLKTVQNSEWIAYLNGTLKDAVRNSPSGFSVTGYGLRYGERRTPETPTGYDVNGNPVWGAPPVVFQISEGAIVVSGSGDGDAMVTQLVSGLRRAAARTVGVNGRLSAALDRM